MATITLEGRPHEIAPFKFKVLRQVANLFVNVGLEIDQVSNVGLIVENALRTTKPDLPVGHLDDMSPSWSELMEAVKLIGRLNGVYGNATGDTEPGEANAGT